MENQRHQIQYSTGKLVLQSPCAVGKEAFTNIEDRNKFCSQCKKVVYDMRKLSESEIKALFAANNGNVCGSIQVRIPKPESVKEELPRFQIRKPLYFKQLAAAASFILLSQPFHTKGSNKPLISFQSPTQNGSGMGTKADSYSKTNTLVTGVIINQDSQVVPLDIPVFIFANKKLIAEVQSHSGLFSCELGDKLHASDIIEVVVKKHQVDQAEIDGQSYGGGKSSCTLGDGQNIRLKIQYDFPFLDIQVDGGLGWIDDEPLPPVEPEKVDESPLLENTDRNSDE